MPVLSAPAEVSLKNILVATDLAPGALSALNYVLPLARQFHATVHILHVVPRELSDVVSPAKSSLLFEQLPTVAQQRLNSLTIMLGDVPHHMWLRQGQVWEEVRDLVQRNHIDLVVVGASGKTHVNKILLGSVAEEVFRETTCPVLTVGPQVGPSSSSLNLRQILYSTNLREESHGGLDYAISLTRQYRAQLTLLHIVEQDEPKSSNDQWLKPDYQLLRQLVSDEDLSIEPRFRIEVTKNTSVRILRVAEEIAADLIVMDVRPEEPWATHLLDRAYEIISFSSCPVLTVRTRAGMGLQER